MPLFARVRRVVSVDRLRPRDAAIQRAVDDELQFHLATRVDELVQQGLSRAEAEARALREFGDVAASRAELTELDRRRLARRRRSTWWDELRQDVRVALGVLRAQPSFTAVILFTTALGIGANGAIYTVVDAALLRPLPYREPERLVHLSETKQGFDERSRASYPDFIDWRAQTATFEGLEGYDGTNVTIGADEPFRAQGGRTTAGFFRLLGVRPILGRDFAEGEDGPGGARIVMLSYSFWQRHFGGDAHVVGRTLTVDDEPREIIGVLPATFVFAALGEDHIWLPLDRDVVDWTERFDHWLAVIGRLRPGVSLARAQNDLDVVMRRLDARYPESNAGRGVAVVPLREEMVGQVRPTMLVLLAAVALLLLIACANVASLLLARAMARAREMAVRVALGARRGRLVRQLLTESLLLALGGGVVAVWLARQGVRALVVAVPENVRSASPYLQHLNIDGRVLAYLAAIAIGTGVAFGLAPALFASRPSVTSLVGSDRRSTAGASRVRLRNALVVFEVTLTVALLIGAGLLGRSLTRLLHVDPGFDAMRALTFRVALPNRTYDSVSAQRRFFETLMARVRAIPGVQAVGAVSNLPLNGGGTLAFHIDGQPEPDPARRPETVDRAVAGDYFKALGIRLVDGRALDVHDDSAAPQAIMISESLARRYFGGARAIGARLRFYAWADQPWTVVGVVADVKTTRLDVETPPTIYYSHLQGAENRMSLVVRSSSAPTRSPRAYVASYTRSTRPFRSTAYGRWRAP